MRHDDASDEALRPGQVDISRDYLGEPIDDAYLQAQSGSIVVGIWQYQCAIPALTVTGTPQRRRFDDALQTLLGQGYPNGAHTELLACVACFGKGPLETSIPRSC
jgi:hypothetical protein